MLHPSIAAELLDNEVAVAEERHRHRGARLDRDGTKVHLWTPGLTDDQVVCLDAASYDTEPVGVTVLDRPGGRMEPFDRWPPGFGADGHPSLGRPFVCVRGTLDYHSHPSHLDDRWDRYRDRLRLPDLVGHLLTRLGR